MSILGNPILLGETDTFAAAMYTKQSMTTSTGGVVNLSSVTVILDGWNMTFDERASAANGIVTINSAGHYMLTYWANRAYSINPGTVTYVVYHNGTVIENGSRFEANAGDTVRIRATLAGNADPRLPASATVIVTALLEKVPASS